MSSLNEKFFKTMGFSLMGFGILMMLLSLYMYFAPEREVDPLKQRQELTPLCMEALKKESFKVKTTGEGLVAKRWGLSSFENKIYSSSYALKSCAGFTLKNFCMGNSCIDEEKANINGIVLRLKFNNLVKK